MKMINHKTRTILLVVLGCLVGGLLLSYQFIDQVDGGVGEVPPAEEKSKKTTSKGLQFTKADLQLIAVKKGNKSLKKPITGRVVPRHTTAVFAEVQGKVLAGGFKLREGNIVRKGELLLALDAREFQLQLESQRSAFFNILTGMMPDLKADYPDN